MKKRSQITIFIIIGLVILITFVMIYYLTVSVPKRELEQITFEEIVFPVKSFTESCLEKTAEDSILFTSKQGGYYDLPEDSILFLLNKYPYYYVDGKKIVPDKTKLENEISKYVNLNIDDCIGNFKVFKETAIQIKAEQKPSVETKIYANKIAIILNYPLLLRKGKIEKELDKFQVDIKTNLNEINVLSKKIIDSYAEKPGFLCLTCLEELEYNEEKIDVQMIPVYDEELLTINSPRKTDVLFVVLTDKADLIAGKQTRFMFVMDFALK